MSEAMVWGTHGQNITSVIVDTPDIVRARFLSDVYHRLTKQTEDFDERLKVLLDVKHVVNVRFCFPIKFLYSFFYDLL